MIYSRPPTCEFLKLNPEIWLKETLLSCHTQTIRSFVFNFNFLPSFSSSLHSSTFFSGSSLACFFFLPPLHYYNLSHFYLFFFHFYELFFSLDDIFWAGRFLITIIIHYAQAFLDNFYLWKKRIIIGNESHATFFRRLFFFLLNFPLVF